MDTAAKMAALDADRQARKEAMLEADRMYYKAMNKLINSFIGIFAVWVAVMLLMLFMR